MIETILISMAVMGGLGLFFALILIWASNKFKVEAKVEVPKADPKKVKEVIMLLPKVNCKRCGYDTCGLYAMTAVAGQCEPDLCVGVDDATTEKIKKIIEE